MRPLRILGLVVLSAALVLGAATPARAAVPVDPKRYLIYDDGPAKKWGFATAGGDVQCSVEFERGYSDWGCIARSHTWPDRRLPEVRNCGAGRTPISGAILINTYEGGFFRPCTPWVRTGEPYRALPAGGRISVEGITCTASRVRGVTQIACAGPKGSRLTISRTRLAYTDPH